MEVGTKLKRTNIQIKVARLDAGLKSGPDKVTSPRAKILIETPTSGSEEVQSLLKYGKSLSNLSPGDVKIREAPKEHIHVSFYTGNGSF